MSVEMDDREIVALLPQSPVLEPTHVFQPTGDPELLQISTKNFVGKRKPRPSMDYKELPPPPPTPVHEPNLENEYIQFSETDVPGGRQRSYIISQAATDQGTAGANQLAPKSSPLWQVASQGDDKINKNRSSDYKRRFGGFLNQKSVNNRRATMQSPTRRERSSSTSSSHGVSKSSSGPASSVLNMASLRATIHGPVTSHGSLFNQSRSSSENCPRPSLRGRQISSPIMYEQPQSPTFSPRSDTSSSTQTTVVSPYTETLSISQSRNESFSNGNTEFSSRPGTSSSTLQSRSESFSTQATGSSQNDGPMSYFSSDSEDEKEGKGLKTPSSNHGSVEKRNGQSGRFRRGLSFLTCGKD